MRTNPFTDAWLFVTGQQAGQTALGLGHWPIVVLFDLLVLGSVLIFTVGFAHSTSVHNAAHDTRHTLAFPCH